MCISKQHISVDEVRKLLQDSSWRLDQKLSRHASELTKLYFRLYEHPNGQILNALPLDDGGHLFATKSDFLTELERLASLANSSFGQHILTDILPQGENFIEHVPALVDELAVLLGIPRAELDGTLASLSKVDNAVMSIGPAECMELPYAPALIAYAGEVIRNERGGQWKMFISKQDGKTWEPWIVDTEGYYCSILDTIITLDDEYPSIAGATYIETITRRRERF